MEPRAIAKEIRDRYPDEVLSVTEFGDQVSLVIRKGMVREIMRNLRETPGYGFDFLQDLCGVDYLGEKTVRFEVVYHLFSLPHRHMIRIRAEVPEEDCSIDSVVDLWSGANWFERECFDMFGILFKGHPDLRRVLMPEDWEGHPLRKDYPLESDLRDGEWKDYRDVIALAEQNRRHEVR